MHTKRATCNGSDVAWHCHYCAARAIDGAATSDHYSARAPNLRPGTDCILLGLDRRWWCVGLVDDHQLRLMLIQFERLGIEQLLV